MSKYKGRGKTARLRAVDKWADDFIVKVVGWIFFFPIMIIIWLFKNL